MERAVFKHKDEGEVVIMIWEGYGFWFAAEDGAYRDDVICECYTRREVGFALVKAGFTFVRSI